MLFEVADEDLAASTSPAPVPLTEGSSGQVLLAPTTAAAAVLGTAISTPASAPGPLPAASTGQALRETGADKSTEAVGAPEPPREREEDAEEGERVPVEDEAQIREMLAASSEAVRAVHLTSWVAGAPKQRRAFLERLRGTVINSVVVALKETDGRVYIPGVAQAHELGTYLPAITDPESMLKEMKARGLRVIGRIVVFKDNALPRKRPDWAVKRPDGSLWRNANGIAWVDPYRREIWDYNIAIALRAAHLGFDEIQFDYIRFPSDGNTRLCRYSRPDHSRRSAIWNLREFLRTADEKLEKTGVPVSAAVFGMTTTAKDDMGIGQEIEKMSSLVDYVSPMMYPSHYARGEYALRYPNKEPYKVIHRGLRDARRRLRKDAFKLRPYLQDFSLGFHYGPAQVRAQILAAKAQGVMSWILWNPSNKYTWEALSPGRN